MVFVIEDYTDVLYSVIKNCEIPHVTEGKFVQLKNEETEYIIFSPYELSKYHANIIERFCSIKNRNIPIQFNAAKDECSILDDEWEILGGGHWMLENGNLHLKGSSKAYGKYRRGNILIRHMIETGNFERVTCK